MTDKDPQPSQKSKQQTDRRDPLEGAAHDHEFDDHEAHDDLSNDDERRADERDDDIADLEPPRLYRSDDRKIRGVCGGIADYFGIDVTLVRLFFVGMVFVGGSTVLVYFILALVLPHEFEVLDPQDDPRDYRARNRQYWAQFYARLTHNGSWGGHGRGFNSGRHYRGRYSRNFARAKSWRNAWHEGDGDDAQRLHPGVWARMSRADRRAYRRQRRRERAQAFAQNMTRFGENPGDRMQDFGDDMADAFDPQSETRPERASGGRKTRRQTTQGGPENSEYAKKRERAASKKLDPRIQLAAVKKHFAELEDRLEGLEKAAVSRDWNLRKAFRDLETKPE